MVEFGQIGLNLEESAKFANLVTLIQIGRAGRIRHYNYFGQIELNVEE